MEGGPSIAGRWLDFSSPAGNARLATSTAGGRVIAATARPHRHEVEAAAVLVPPETLVHGCMLRVSVELLRALFDDVGGVDQADVGERLRDVAAAGGEAPDDQPLEQRLGIIEPADHRKLSASQKLQMKPRKRSASYAVRPRFSPVNDVSAHRSTAAAPPR